MYDLCLIVRRCAKWVIAVPVICWLLAGGLVRALDQMKERSFEVDSMLTATNPATLAGATVVAVSDPRCSSFFRAPVGEGQCGGNRASIMHVVNFCR